MTCGIYSITSPSGKCYIGSSINVERRFKQHKLELRNNRHHGFKLQAAYLKYFGALVYQIVEVCPEDILRHVEQEYLDAYKPEYNSTYDAYSPMRDPSIAAKMRTPEARERARQHSIILNRVANLNTPEVEHRRKITRESAQYRAESADRAIKRNAVSAMHTPEARAKMTASRRTPESRAISRSNVLHVRQQGRNMKALGPQLENQTRYNRL
jgi:group I intron endonuclease